MTDYKALTDDLEEWVKGYLISDPADECTAESFERIDRVRAALAADPVGEGPSDEELVQLAFREKLGRLDSNGNIITRYYYPIDIGENVIAFARAVLARWGTPAAPPAPLPGEVAVSDWQPIDTAPKDGTEILASDYDAIEIVSWKSYETGSGWESRWGESLFCAWWQPLDHPPLSLSAPQAEEVQP